MEIRGRGTTDSAKQPAHERQPTAPAHVSRRLHSPPRDQEEAGGPIKETYHSRNEPMRRFRSLTVHPADSRRSRTRTNTHVRNEMSVMSVIRVRNVRDRPSIMSVIEVGGSAIGDFGGWNQSDYAESRRTRFATTVSAVGTNAASRNRASNGSNERQSPRLTEPKMEL